REFRRSTYCCLAYPCFSLPCLCFRTCNPTTGHRELAGAPLRARSRCHRYPAEKLQTTTNAYYRAPTVTVSSLWNRTGTVAPVTARTYAVTIPSRSRMTRSVCAYTRLKDRLIPALRFAADTDMLFTPYVIRSIWA